MCVCVRVYLSTARYSVGEIDGYGEQLADSFLAGRQQTVVAGLVLAYELGRTRRRHCSSAHAPSSKKSRHQTRARGKKGSPYSITERRVPELIPVLGDQPAGGVINLAVGCHYFPPGLQLPSQPLRGLLPILLLGEQRGNGCEQIA